MPWERDVINSMLWEILCRASEVKPNTPLVLRQELFATWPHAQTSEGSLCTQSGGIRKQCRMSL